MPVLPRVLVTGATGLVGRAIVRALLAQRRIVRIFALDPHAAYALFGSMVEIYTGDIRHYDAVRKACQGIDQVFHVAGAVDIHHYSDQEMMDSNVAGTGRMLEASGCAGASRFVYTSSVSVYGDGLAMDIDEGTPLNPATSYGESKVGAEALVQKAVVAGLHAMIVRPCIVYGPGDRYFVPQAARAMQLPVVPLPDGGRHVVDVVHADDLATAHLMIMQDGQAGAAYNVTDGGRHRVNELLSWVAGALERRPWRPTLSRWSARALWPIVHFVGRMGNMPELANLRWQDVPVFFSDYHFDIAKIKALGYVPRIDAKTALPAAVRARFPMGANRAHLLEREQPTCAHCTPGCVDAHLLDAVGPPGRPAAQRKARD